MQTAPEKFRLAVTSDPQYPWYDFILPPGLGGEEDEYAANSERQIREQYEAINGLAGKEGDPPVEGVIINGDLTAFGHEAQLEKYKELIGALEPKVYPGLGNHDYSNNVNDCANNNCSTGMVLYMLDWLRSNEGRINGYDMTLNSYYKFPELRTDFRGSLAYSFNLGPVHCVVLHNFPSYSAEWDSWAFAEARRQFFYIKPSLWWLENDLAKARNAGDTILVFLHDYNDSFIEPQLGEFQTLMGRYQVSAVFAGHIHEQCEMVDMISSPVGDSIPVFRSGAASFQDFLLLDLDLESDSLKVTKWSAPEAGAYEANETWTAPLRGEKPQPPMPVPPPAGRVTFFNDGPFVAQFELRYKDYTGETYEFETGTMLQGEKKEFEVPAYATEIYLEGQKNAFPLGWRPTFNLSLEKPPNQTYRLFGTAWDHNWDNQD